MKTYFTSKELPHQWAHQLAPHGKCPGHERFDGVSYYSYGTEIARIITHGKRKAYLLNVESYSVTTSSHQNGVRRAIPSEALTFEIGGGSRGSGLHDATGARLFDYAVERAAKAAEAMPRARKQSNKDHLAAEQARWLKQAENASAFFGLRRKVDARAVERLAARIAADERRKAEAARELQARREQQEQETIAAWLSGEPVQFPYGVEHSERIRKTSGVGMKKEYQPKTGAKCSCKRGIQRDNCPQCEGTGWIVDFKAIRKQPLTPRTWAGELSADGVGR